MKFLSKIFALMVLAIAAAPVNAQTVTIPGADPLVCNDGDTMKACQVLKLDPASFSVEEAGELRVSIVEDSRCPRFARCRELGRIVLKLSLIESIGVEALPIEIEYKRNQENLAEIELSDGRILRVNILAVTHRVPSLPLEQFEVKIGYSVDVM